MDSRQNSIRYDAEKQELHIVTCYNKLQYKTLWIQDPYLCYTRYLLYAKDRELHRLPVLNRFWAYLLFCRVVILLGTLYVTVTTVQSLFTNFRELPLLFLDLFLLAGAVLLWVLFFRMRAVILHNSARVFSRRKVPKKLRPTWEAIDQGFAAQPVFRQEVTLTPETFGLTVPYPDVPPLHYARSKFFLRVLAGEKDLYFLQVQKDKGEQNHTGRGIYVCPYGLYFVKRNYTDADWTTLLTALQEMKYL